MAKFIPGHLDTEVDESDVTDATRYIDLTEETDLEKKDLIRSMLGVFEYTHDEIEEFVADIDLDLSIKKINHALSRFVRSDRYISNEYKYMFPIYRDPISAHRKRRLFSYILDDKHVDPVDEHVVEYIISNIDYTIDSKFVVGSLMKWLRSSMNKDDSRLYLAPIFAQQDVIKLPYRYPTGPVEYPPGPVEKAKLDKDRKYSRKRKPTGTIGGVPTEMEIVEREQVEAVRRPSHVLKTEEEVDRAMTPEIAINELLRKRLEGEDIFCVFCDKIIDPLEEMSLWYNVYPAHMTCIREQLDAADAKRTGSVYY